MNVINTDKLISWMTDLITCWPIILASVGYCLVIAIIYMVLIRCCAGTIAYSTIILILAALAGLGYVFQQRMDYYKSIKDENYELTMKVLCGLFYSLAGLWLLMVLFMCNKIRLSIALVEVTAKYISQTWSVLFVPFIFYILSALYYAYWVALSVYLYSSGTVTSSNSFIPSVTWTSTTRYAWWYHLFALFYMNAFLNALNQFVLASSACIWYFEHRIEGGASRPVSRSFWRAFRYHLGSIAFGSLIVAIIRFMMAIVEYIKQKVDSSGVGDKVGRLYKCLLTCCQCCLECVARLVEFINKHAYIQVKKSLNN
jgi:solute carrier family 44 (choline transporter-like protein), member 2/4/5